MTDYELLDYLMTLTGYTSSSDRGVEEDDEEYDAVQILQNLPQNVTATQFMEELLGLSTN